jgi:hypothetical protein
MSSRESVPAGTIYLGLDVHKDSVTIAVLPSDAIAPTRVERLPNDLAKLRRLCERLRAQGEVRACYEASGAGYVLDRAFTSWGYHCDVIAPSLIPTKPGQQRKHDQYDAAQLARLHRAGELTVIRIPSEAEERVRGAVRCREAFQREFLKSRHYILKFLTRRGFVFREGTDWRQPHYGWLRRLSRATSPLAPEDRHVFRDYLGLVVQCSPIRRHTSRGIVEECERRGAQTAREEGGLCTARPPAWGAGGRVPWHLRGR